MADTKSVSIPSLVMVPALITLGITILRLIGELQHWPRPWFSPAPGGGGALVGISWLPIILGPYFALKLAGSGDGPASTGKAVGFAFLALVPLFLAAFGIATTLAHPSVLTFIAFALALVAAFVPRLGWSELGSALLAYAFAARIPVLLVMFFAMRANGGAGLGTHYDAVPPAFAHLSFARKFFYLAFLPQMTSWIGWTAVVGSIFGTVAVALARLRKRTAEPAV